MIPDGLRYTKDHEWAKKDGDTIVVGVTHYAQDQLGDVVFVELPAVGRTIKAGETFGVVEAVKTVSDLFAPLGAKSSRSTRRSPASPAWSTRRRTTRAG